MKAICQTSIPFDVWTPRPLPGIQPTTLSDVLIRDDAFDGQLAERDRLLRTQRDSVLQMQPSARPAAQELLDLVLGLAYPAQVGAREIERPDGVVVPLDREDPLGTLGRLVQEDFCILQKQADEHVLSGAVLCFPASWMLAEKFGRPLMAIHVPVDSYDDNVGRRVQRLFDGVKPDRPLWRFNALPYNDPTLHQPRSQHARRQDRNDARAQFLRSERQVILRLPETGAVVFAIHTFLLPWEVAEAARLRVETMS